MVASEAVASRIAMMKLRAIARHHYLGSRDGLRDDDDDDLVFGTIYVVRFSIFTAHIGCIHRTLLSEGTDFFFAFAFELGPFSGIRACARSSTTTV